MGALSFKHSQFSVAQPLIGGGRRLGDLGFGCKAKQAMQSIALTARQELAQRREKRVAGTYSDRSCGPHDTRQD